MPSKTHASRANSAIASLKFNEQVDTKRGVFVVGRDFLGDFPVVAFVCAGAVVGERFGAGEFVVA